MIYGTMYGMQKTTIYLPKEIKSALKRASKRRACSEAEVVREAILRFADNQIIRPRLPLFTSNQPDLAERADEFLKGFGER
jgi:hypothetical protein